MSSRTGQSHIGMALRLATSTEARSRRRETLLSALNMRGVSSAMLTADQWLSIAKKDADALTAQRDEAERHPRVEPGAKLADEPGAQHELLARDVGFGRRFR